MFKIRTMAAMGVGYAAGYVAGTRAGRPAYDRISEMAGRLMGMSGIPTSSVDPNETATTMANEEIADLHRAGAFVPGRPDDGRSHGPTVAP